MVNAKRLEKKLPSLLVDDCSRRHKKGWNDYMRIRNRLARFKKQNPERYNTITNRVVSDLGEWEKAVNTS